MPPAKVLALVTRTVPAPALPSAPSPLMTPLSSRVWLTLKASKVPVAPAAMLMLPGSVSPPPVRVRWSVPPVPVKLSGPEPSDAALAKATTPPPMLVPPL